MKHGVLVVVVALACNGGVTPPQTTTTATTSEPPATQTTTMTTTSTSTTTTTAPEPQPAKNVTIESVQIANPIVVTGRARTFEQNVALRVRDARGRVISEDFTTSVGELGHHNPYRGTVWLTSDPGARVTVEALEYSAKDGSEQSLVKVERPFDVELTHLELSFPDDQCTKLITVPRAVPKTQSIARVTVLALLREPLENERAAGARSPFPKGSGLQSVNLRDGVLTVDFNERLRNVGGACRAEMIRRSVTETLRRLPNVREVVITAGGSRELALQP